MQNKFLKATFILMIGGLITKLLGFAIRIIYTRMVGSDAINLYSLVMPTYSLLLTVATLSLPLVISKLISEQKEKSIKILSSASVITLILNILVITAIYFTKDFIANSLLHDPRCSILLMAMALTFPFVSLSSILKGYFYGKQKMVPHTISNVIEQLVRIILIFFIIPSLVNKGIVYSVMGLILISIASELASIFTFLVFLPKKFKITKEDLKPDMKTAKEILNISIPTVSGRLVGNVGFFFEPIILTNILLFAGYSMDFILNEYGAYNAYTISLLSMPSFFIAAISSSLLPEISKYFYHKNYIMVKRRLKQAMILSFVVGIIFSSFIYLFREPLLSTLYNTTKGSEYIEVLAPFFVLFYLEGPLQSVLQAIGKAKTTMFITMVAVIAKLVTMAILSLCHIGMYSLVIAEIIDIFIIVILCVKAIRKELYSIN